MLETCVCCLQTWRHHNGFCRIIGEIDMRSINGCKRRRRYEKKTEKKKENLFHEGSSLPQRTIKMAGLIEGPRMISGRLCDALGVLNEACSPHQRSDFPGLCL